MTRVPVEIAFAFEEIEPGDTLDLGSYTFTREAIIAFARQFDPQPFHLSDEAAAQTYFGTLSASGWHTAAIWMKLMIATRQRQVKERLAAGLKMPAMGPSPGFSNLRWLKPVRAGDTVHYRSVTTGKRELASRHDFGLIFGHNTGHNQHGELVFTFDGRYFAGRLG